MNLGKGTELEKGLENQERLREGKGLSLEGFKSHVDMALGDTDQWWQCWGSVQTPWS